MGSNRNQSHPPARRFRLLAAATLIAIAVPACPPRALGQATATCVTGSGVSAGDGFGYAVAVDGDWMVVGAPWHDAAGADAGGVWVFQRQGHLWQEFTTLLPAAGSTGAGFGVSVAISGGTLAVGAWGDSAGGSEAGAVYTYAWDCSGWASQGACRPAEPRVEERFGTSVSLSGDCLAVGAYGANDLAGSGGAAYVFARDGGPWQQQIRLTSPGAQLGDYFGWSVAMDGAVLAVGAYGQDAPAAINVGAVHVYTQIGGQWSPTPSASFAGAEAGDEFGKAVALNGDTLLASAPGAGVGGLAQVYRQSAGQWSPESVLAGPAVADGDQFGASASLDGDDAIIGAPGRGPNGAAYAFTRASGAWQPAEAFVAGASPAWQLAGTAVAIRDGLALAGAPGKQSSTFGGGVYTFAAGTRSAWQAPPGTAGQWSDANNWSAGMPSSAIAAVVAGPDARVEVTAESVTAGALEIGQPGQARLTLQDAHAEFGQLRIGPGGVVSADAGSTITLSGSLANESGSPASLDIAAATVRWNAPGQQQASLEVAGCDLGPVPAGWTDNASIGRLIVGAGSLLALTDIFDNAEGAGPEALYVDELTIEPGGRITLAGLSLYYRNGGQALRLTEGDGDHDGDVDLVDLRTLSANFGRQGGGWSAGDYDGDGVVGSADYMAVKLGIGTAQLEQGVRVPEPAAALVLAVGAMAGGLGSRRRASRGR